MQVHVHSLEDTQRLGLALGKKLESGDVVFLTGDLGSGKTTFVQYLVRGLGIDPKEYVSSPSFTLINQYQGYWPIYHVDLYRIESFDDLDSLGLDEILGEEEGIILIEWAEKLLDPTIEKQFIDPESRIEINIIPGDGEKRLFTIETVGMEDRKPSIFPLL